MNKKILFFTLIVFLSLGFFIEQVFALEEPVGITHSDPGIISVTLYWTWPPPAGEGPGTIRRFVLAYRIQDSGEEWTKLWPSYDDAETDYSYGLSGLLPDNRYEWTIMAEATDPTFNSAEVLNPPDSFKTDPIPLNGDENGDENGDDDDWWSAPVDLMNPLNKDTLWEVIDALTNFLLLLAFAIAPVLLIYSAFLIMFRGEDAKAVNRAKTIILWTLLAIALILFAKGLPAAIKGALGG